MLKINDLRQSPVVKFDDLKMGDVFEFSNNVYLKIGGSSNNAVNLTVMALVSIKPETQVSPLNAELKICGIKSPN